MMEEANWSDIPEDIGKEIAIRIQLVDDLARFGAVSKSWQSSILKRVGPCSPWLMLPEEGGNSDNNKLRKFYCLSSKRVIKIRFPEASGKRCIGSHFGWLLSIGHRVDLHLLNPLSSHSQIPLPSPQTFARVKLGDTVPEVRSYECVSRFTMSSHPSSPTCTVMVVYAGGYLAFARPDAQAWTDVQGPKEGHDDVIFFKDKFYTIGHTTKMVRVCDDIDAPRPELIDLVPAPDVVRNGLLYAPNLTAFQPRLYLVEMSGDLHLVARYFDEEVNFPGNHGRVLPLVFNYFHVYKLDWGLKAWIMLATLGEYAIFVGTHSTFSISTSDHPLLKLKANSIYFTDEYGKCHINGDGGGRDMGIYDFEEGTFKPFYWADDILSTFSTPMLFMPSLS